MYVQDKYGMSRREMCYVHRYMLCPVMKYGMSIVIMTLWTYHILLVYGKSKMDIPYAENMACPKNFQIEVFFPPIDPASKIS